VLCGYAPPPQPHPPTLPDHPPLETQDDYLANTKLLNGPRQWGCMRGLCLK